MFIQVAAHRLVPEAESESRRPARGRHPDAPSPWTDMAETRRCRRALRRPRGRRWPSSGQSSPSPCPSASTAGASTSCRPASACSWSPCSGAMLLGGLNYNNNPALLLVFVLGAVVHNSLRACTPDPVRRAPEGPARRPGVRRPGAAACSCRFDADGGARTPGTGASLRRRLVRLRPRCQRRARARAAVADAPRGWLDPGRLRLSTIRPLGLARAWCWLRPDTRLLVYPAPDAEAPPLPAALRRWRFGAHALAGRATAPPARLPPRRRRARSRGKRRRAPIACWCANTNPPSPAKSRWTGARWACSPTKRASADWRAG